MSEKGEESTNLVEGDVPVGLDDLQFNIDIDELGNMITNGSKDELEKFGGVEGLAKSFNVDLKSGLSKEEATTDFAARRAYFGKNTYQQPKMKTFLQLWLEALNDLTMIILIISAIVSIILGFAVPSKIGTDVICYGSSDSVSVASEEEDKSLDGIEGFGILIAVIVVSTVSAGNNYSKEKKFRDLAAKESDISVKVRRGGEVCEISITEVNVGDVVLVDTGSQVPADGVYFRGSGIQVDESQVNGETTPSKKSIENPFFVSGCKLTDGSGEFLVVSVGDNSQWGRIMKQLQTKDRDTPLQENLDEIAKLISIVGVSVAGLVFVVLTLTWLIPTAQASNAYECLHASTDSKYDPCYVLDDASSNSLCRPINKWNSATKVVEYFIVAITIIAVAVPEGLPLAVTLSLAYSMKQMFEDKNLVRKLKACETMSNCTNICSDKTGTLTENRMTVVGSWVAGKKWTSNIRKAKKEEDDDDLDEVEREARDAERRRKLFAEFDRQGGGLYSCFKCKRKNPSNIPEEVEEEEEDAVEMSKTAADKADAPEYSDAIKNILDVSFSMNSGQTSNFMIEKRKIDEDVDEVAELLVTTGNKTECALLMHLQLCGRDYRATRENCASQVYQTFPFSSARKRMSTLMWLDRDQGILRMHIKGAPEIIMGRSLYYLEDKGDGNKPEIKSLSKSKRKEMKKQLDQWAEQGLRTLCIGYRDIKVPTGAEPVNPVTIGTEGIDTYECHAVKDHKKIMKKLKNDKKQEDDGDEEGKNAPANVTSPLGLGAFDEPIACHMEDGVWKFDESPDSGIIIVALMGIEDPVRPEVPPAVELCQMAGVKVRMVTGDNIMTARSIARQCKILTSDDGAIEGPVFAKLSDDEIRARLDTIDVIARCSPFDKQRLVQLLIEEGEVVAVTGDGTNDVLALKAADVGLAMGIRGTDIAKQASDIVILDDNFKSIVRSVMWGRNVYDNIRKFLQFQLTVNFSALFIVFIGAIGQHGAPLKAIQLLWVNLIMDTLAALALGTEKPTGELLNRKPFGRYDCLISPYMLRFILIQGLYQILLLLLMLFLGPNISFLDVPCAYWTKPTDACPTPTSKMIKDQTTLLQSTIFNVFVYCQVFNQINARYVNGERNVFKGILSNIMFVSIWSLIAFGQAALVIFTGPFMSVTPFPGIGWKQWLTSIVLGLVSLPLGFLSTFIPVPKRKPRKKLSEAQSCCGIKPHDYNADKLADEEEERERREQAKILTHGNELP